jgi:hypothetical protein
MQERKANAGEEANDVADQKLRRTSVSRLVPAGSYHRLGVADLLFWLDKTPKDCRPSY